MLYYTAESTLYFSEVEIIYVRKVCARICLFEGLSCSPVLLKPALKYTLMGDFMATFIALNGVCLNVPRQHHNILAGPGRCVLPAAPDAEFLSHFIACFYVPSRPRFHNGQFDILKHEIVTIT